MKLSFLICKEKNVAFIRTKLLSKNVYNAVEILKKQRYGYTCISQVLYIHVCVFNAIIA